jgi:hypothetical protein
MYESTIEKPADYDFSKLLKDTADAIKEYDDYSYAIRNENNIIPPEKISELKERFTKIRRKALDVILMAGNDKSIADTLRILDGLRKELEIIKETFHDPIDKLRADEGTCRETQF